MHKEDLLYKKDWDYREILEKGAQLETKLSNWQGMVKSKW